MSERLRVGSLVLYGREGCCRCVVALRFGIERLTAANLDVIISALEEIRAEMCDSEESKCQSCELLACTDSDPHAGQ